MFALVIPLRLINERSLNGRRSFAERSICCLFTLLPFSESVWQNTAVAFSPLLHETITDMSGWWSHIQSAVLGIINQWWSRQDDLREKSVLKHANCAYWNENTRFSAPHLRFWSTFSLTDKGIVNMFLASVCFELIGICLPWWLLLFLVEPLIIKR